LARPPAEVLFDKLAAFAATCSSVRSLFGLPANTMRLSKPTAVIVLLALLALGTAVYLLVPPRFRSAPAEHVAVHRSSAATPTPALATRFAAQEAVPASAATARLHQTLAALRATKDPGAARGLLAELRAYLTSLPRAEAVAVTQGFLNAGADAPTALDFKLTPDGSLTEAPTLRVWLLDTLGEIDRAAAADYATGILARAGSPDEWAVSLRDYARVRTTPGDTAFLELKLRQMLGNAAWRQKPSAGFLEAFDTIVHLGGTRFTPDLTQMVRDRDNRAVAHAAFLTLDRLVLHDAPAVLEQLQAQPGLMEGREQTRANYFARADVRDPRQRAVVESYLLDPARSPVELQTFAGLYPSGNYMISNNLLTKPVTPTQAELAAHDRQALATVERWLADPRFEKLKPQLEQIRTRVAGFVQESR
jgi:hypothetical protein